MISGIFFPTEEPEQLHNESLSNKLRRNAKKYQIQLKLYFSLIYVFICQKVKK